jgi:hypothetical protein
MSFRAWAEMFKIDFLPILGLAGTPGSLGYKIHNMEKYLQAAGLQYGMNAGTGFLDNTTMNPFVLTAGAVAETYSVAQQISAGTEILAGDPTKAYNFYRVLVLGCNQTGKTYKVRFWTGTTDFAGATRRGEFCFRASSALDVSNLVPVTMIDTPCNYKVWAECMCETGGKTISFIVDVIPFI